MAENQEKPEYPQYPVPALDGIRINSVGFIPEYSKRATIVGAKSDSFSLVDTQSGRTVFSAPLEEIFLHPDSQEQVSIADFSGFTQTGEYLLRIEGLPDSVPFSIGSDSLDHVLDAVMIGFYGQRCGCAVSFEYDGDTYEHAPCHLHDGYLDYYDPEHAGEIKDATGGWHDAGDYGKYIVNSGISCGMMLKAWECFGDKLQHLELDIPEHDGPIPDYLAEIKYNLDWMLKMQFEDGRVSHKLTPLNFSAFGMPEDDTEKRYFAPWGTQANANFAATFFMASRVYRPFDETYADQCLEAAKKAWAAMEPWWREVRPDQSAFRTGHYNSDSKSDRTWAMLEYLVTAPEEFSEQLKGFIKGSLVTDNPTFDVDWDWGKSKNIGLYSYLFTPGVDREPLIVEQLEEDLLFAADRIIDNWKKDGYGRGLRSFYWGVNGGIARTPFNLYFAYKLTGDKKYLDVAMEQLSYLLGRNPYNRSFITGIGHMPPMFPHHRPSASDEIEKPWPGHLVGGANPGELDWNDKTPDPRTNENAINWDAALAFALAIFYEAP